VTIASSKRIFVLVLLGVTLTVMPVYAWDKRGCVEINLVNGQYTPSTDPSIVFLVTPTDSNGDGWFETVLQITINNKIHPNKEAIFNITYTGAPFETSVDIGDSRTNDSGGGDAGTQSNDAEIDIGRAEPETSNNFYAFGHDGYPTSPLGEVDGFVQQGDTVELRVSDGRVEYVNERIPLAGEFLSPWLYALKGQPDTEGPVNYNIFASFNRVIAGTYRIGTGVGFVEVCLRDRRN
jgi:hypothetical protein